MNKDLQEKMRPTSNNGMRLLICSQAADRSDPVLGFFHGWIAELSTKYDAIEVVCLQAADEYELSANVHVHSLGKRSGKSSPRGSFGKLISRVRYAARLYRLVWRLRRSYDAVFVHQNEEYVLLAGLLWRLMGKRVYLWRNHYKGTFLTNIAVALVRRVYCTSAHSYTARFSNAVIMPVGIDTERFKYDPSVKREPRSILSLGRIAPSKHLDLIVKALAQLREKGIDFTAAFFGDALPRDAAYEARLHALVRERAMEDRTAFHPGVPNEETPALYSRFEIFLNASDSGMFDKTIFEAAACGCTVLAASKDFAQEAGEAFTFREGDAADCARAIAEHLGKEASGMLRELAERHSLRVLAEKLAATMSV